MKTTLFVDIHVKKLHTYNEIIDEIEECKCDIFGDFLYDNFDTSDLYDILINGKKIDFEALRKNWDAYYIKRVHQIIEDDYYPQIVEV